MRRFGWAVCALIVAGDVFAVPTNAYQDAMGGGGAPLWFMLLGLAVIVLVIWLSGRRERKGEGARYTLHRRMMEAEVAARAGKLNERDALLRAMQGVATAARAAGLSESEREILLSRLAAKVARP